MTGIIFAVLCAIFIAFSQITLRKSYREFPPSVAFLFDAFFGLLIWIPLAIFMGISGAVNWGQAIFFAFISAILSEAIVFYALSHGELAITTTILATYPVYTVVFSRLINREILSFPVMICVFLAITGSVMASMSKTVYEGKMKINKKFMWPFIAAICIGLSDTISKTYINSSGDFSFLFALGFVQIPVALAYIRIEHQSLTASFRGAFEKFSLYKFALLGGLFNIIGTGFLWLSFSFIPTSIASPVTGTSGALTVLLSRFILKEKISVKKYIGIALAFTGIIGITVLRFI